MVLLLISPKVTDSENWLMSNNFSSGFFCKGYQNEKQVMLTKGESKIEGAYY